MNLLILGKFTDSILLQYVSGYRGVQRQVIDLPIEFYDSNHEIINLYNRYEKDTESDPYIHDYIFAKRLRDIYNKFYPSENREIIEVVFDNGNSELDGLEIGYDIADFYSSNILGIILALNKMADKYENFDDMYKILYMLSKRFVLLLNNYQLFSSYEDAKNTLTVIESIFNIYGKKSVHHEFKIAKLYYIK